MTKKTVTLASFLTTQIVTSNEVLVRTLAKKIERFKTTDTKVMVTMVTAAAKVMRGIGMNEELRLLALLITARCAEKGVDMVDALASITSTSIAPAPVVSSPATNLAPAPIVPANKTAPTKMVAPVTTAKSQTAPARTLVVNGTMAEKLGKVLEGTKLMSPIGKFRQIINQSPVGNKTYWTELRDMFYQVLDARLLEETDWTLVIGKMRGNLFSTDVKTTRMFLAQCPKEKVMDLLFDGHDCLAALVGRIGSETFTNPTSPFRVRFVVDCCEVVGRELSECKALITQCHQVVNRMKQMKFIPADHWILQKMADMKVTSQTTTAKPAPASPEQVAPPAEQPITAVSEGPVNLPKIAPLAPLDPAQEAVLCGKPVVVDEKFEREYAELMEADAAAEAEKLAKAQAAAVTMEVVTAPAEVAPEQTSVEVNVNVVEEVSQETVTAITVAEEVSAPAEEKSNVEPKTNIVVEASEEVVTAEEVLAPAEDVVDVVMEESFGEASEEVAQEAQSVAA